MAINFSSRIDDSIGNEISPVSSATDIGQSSVDVTAGAKAVQGVFGVVENALEAKYTMDVEEELSKTDQQFLSTGVKEANKAEASISQGVPTIEALARAEARIKDIQTINPGVAERVSARIKRKYGIDPIAARAQRAESQRKRREKLEDAAIKAGFNSVGEYVSDQKDKAEYDKLQREATTEGLINKRNFAKTHGGRDREAFKSDMKREANKKSAVAVAGLSAYIDDFTRRAQASIPDGSNASDVQSFITGSRKTIQADLAKIRARIDQDVALIAETYGVDPADISTDFAGLRNRLVGIETMTSSKSVVGVMKSVSSARSTAAKRAVEGSLPLVRALSSIDNPEVAKFMANTVLDRLSMENTKENFENVANMLNDGVVKSNIPKYDSLGKVPELVIGAAKEKHVNDVASTGADINPAIRQAGGNKPTEELKNLEERVTSSVVTATNEGGDLSRDSATKALKAVGPKPVGTEPEELHQFQKKVMRTMKAEFNDSADGIIRELGSDYRGATATAVVGEIKPISDFMEIRMNPTNGMLFTTFDSRNNGVGPLEVSSIGSRANIKGLRDNIEGLIREQYNPFWEMVHNSNQLATKEEQTKAMMDTMASTKLGPYIKVRIGNNFDVPLAITVEEDSQYHRRILALKDKAPKSNIGNPLIQIDGTGSRYQWVDEQNKLMLYDQNIVKEDITGGFTEAPTSDGQQPETIPLKAREDNVTSTSFSVGEKMNERAARGKDTKTTAGIFHVMKGRNKLSLINKFRLSKKTEGKAYILSVEERDGIPSISVPTDNSGITIAGFDIKNIGKDSYNKALGTLAGPVRDNFKKARKLNGKEAEDFVSSLSKKEKDDLLAQAETLFNIAYDDVVAALRKDVEGFDELSLDAQLPLIDTKFHTGQTFEKLAAAAREGDIDTMIKESVRYVQGKPDQRRNRLIKEWILSHRDGIKLAPSLVGSVN